MTKRANKRANKRTDARKKAEENLLAYLSDPALPDEQRRQLRARIDPTALSDALWSLGKQVFADELSQTTTAAQGTPQPAGALAQVWSRVREETTPATAAVLRLFTEIRVLVEKGLASFDSLPNPLAPAWVPLPGVRSKSPATDAADITEKRAQMLPLVSPEHDLAINLTIGPVSDHQASLTVQVMRSSSGQPLPGVRVTLRDEARHLLTGERTQPDGRTTFSHIKSGRYVIEVKQADLAWEMPMAFTWQE